VPRLRAAGPNQEWSWDITYLPTTVRDVWLYLYLVLDVWSHKVFAWDVADEDPAIAAELVSRACLRERISKGRRQPLILHADNGHAGKPAGETGRAQVVLTAARQQQQSVFRISIPHGEVST
jgi:putative transposase